MFPHSKTPKICQNKDLFTFFFLQKYFYPLSYHLTEVFLHLSSIIRCQYNIITFFVSDRPVAYKPCFINLPLSKFIGQKLIFASTFLCITLPFIVPIASCTSSAPYAFSLRASLAWPIWFLSLLNNVSNKEMSLS